jgi:glucose/arabinose dehydrogenase
MTRVRWFGVAATFVLAACSDGGRADDAPSTTEPPGPVIVTTTVPTAPTTSTASRLPTSPNASTLPTPATSAPATTPSADPVVSFESIGDFDQPLDVAWRPGDPTLFVVEQPGTIVAFDPATGERRTALDLTDLTDARAEQGLLGVVIDPTGEVAYVNHIDDGGDTDIAAYAVAADGTFDPASRRLLLEIDQPYSNHNGGDLAIGPDGLLYIGMGDGGSGGDPQRFALDLSSPLGKILRIDPAAPSGGRPYTIPADNPFVATEGALPELFSIGLRNPWRFTFDPVTADLWIADVGQNEFEEVNVVPAPPDGSIAGAGVSFGWSAYEGTERFNSDQPADGHLSPVVVYPHGADCSVSGGAPYRGSAVPDLVGWYVYADYCSGNVWGLDVALGRSLLLGTVAGSVTAVVAGPDQELYVTTAAGPVLRIVAG